MEIKEKTINNRLIAEFMEYPSKLTCKELTESLASRLFYSEYWEWLMPVVEKIETLSFDTRIMSFQPHCKSKNYLFDIEDWKGDSIIYLKGENRIEVVYQGVIKFIKWYNLNKKNI